MDTTISKQRTGRGDKVFVMEESGDSILDLVTNASYCPANVSLASIKRGEISACFIDTVINPLLILVAAAAGNKSKGFQENIQE